MHLQQLFCPFQPAVLVWTLKFYWSSSDNNCCSLFTFTCIFHSTKWCVYTVPHFLLPQTFKSYILSICNLCTYVGIVLTVLVTKSIGYQHMHNIECTQSHTHHYVCRFTGVITYVCTYIIDLVCNVNITHPAQANDIKTNVYICT